ncbi:Transglutaminase-like superfamily-domain-containing protein [Cantharellus anzutake]|uniref:Transglutaminase-like superfamily-domain-containing protein n=1 Tax=Cantharellus anzutake TaxID=1750568 RepID=UPI0019071768|nr:Transglutaminase-like superfamily-domain-containing protein [Cantharellus anzutake]KAF8310618.1 Transglutaminase-like superfamily-domain-containing protein [Cantharellus anzutake]
MPSYLFPEIYEHILEQLPVRDGVLLDDSARTLLQCSRTNSMLRAIACLSHIWKSHYLARWTRSKDHAALEARFGGDYRLMYFERRWRDRRAVKALSRVIQHRCGRHELAMELIEELNYDAWDVLSAQIVPNSGASFAGIDAPTEDWFARNFWAGEILRTMARRAAVEQAIDLENGREFPLERGLGIFSGFWGWSHLMYIATQLDGLAQQCREHLLGMRLILDPDDPIYDRVSVCLEVCHWMRGEGFVAATDTYHDMRNHFMHKVLTTHRKTLPLSLVAVFVAITNRLGIPSKAVGIPGHVHAFVPLSPDAPSVRYHISSYDARNEGIHIDVFNSDSQPFIDVIRLLRVGQQENLKPASTHDMVFRAGRNILTSAQLHQAALEASDLDLSIYAVFCIFLIPSHVGIASAKGFIQQITSIVGQRYPLDVRPILQSVLAPVLAPPLRLLLENVCTKLVEDDEEYHVPTARKPVRYFSGLVYVHRIFDYIAVILEGDDHCHASTSWIVRYGVDSLERGRHQPFYTSAAADGSSRYVAEDNIIPIAHLRNSSYSDHPKRRHFIRPEEGPHGRLVFLPNKDVLRRFPEDVAKAQHYLCTGTVPIPGVSS